MATLRAFCLLLVFQLAGLAVQCVTHIPLPAPVLGMILLAAVLLWRKRPHEPLERTADGLLSLLGLLFVPAGVGVIAELALLRAAWFPLAAGLIVSTLLSLVVTAWTMNRLLSRRPRQTTS